MLTVFRSSAKSAVGILRTNFSFVQIANLMGRRTRGEPLQLKPGFPYQTRRLTELEALMDITVNRLKEENAKLIVIEGPIASGKSAIMKILAEEFDMHYMEQPTLDELYITRSGFDLRTFDDQLPESVRTYDHKNFLSSPRDRKAGDFQLTMLQLRMAQYIDALAHIMNTGQGVILERSAYSDFAFAEAMFSEGHISKPVRDVYILMREHVTPLLLRPHVIIYLDVPVDIVQQRIKQRNLSYEVNSPALTASYLQKLEDVWKNNYLKKAVESSEVLVYDWSDGGDTELIIEDLEKLDLNPLNKPPHGKLFDWKIWRRELRHKRLSYTNDKFKLINYTKLPPVDVDEFKLPVDDMKLRDKLYNSAPGYEYLYGSHPKYDSIWKILLGVNPYSRKMTLMSSN
ncbi:UNVERIFIED_CONTAM: hypothetical protein PYX00_006888 [Menopon gallinae]|uniref:NADH dehydrogenase [ubiquinone] 1 alpha subcomplex subunit 10, mitochondrial n=1 Tax=Menopon gallinae TaxID=328185 RepID=A0AAW2HX56_9NEOP